jgi:pimeloyl-ACP methyl ester carboxylesterase
MNIPYFQKAGSGPPLHFLHANGYPPDSYKPLLELFQTLYHTFGMLLRPLWPNSRMDDVQDWHVFSEDLIRFLTDFQTDPVIGVGHSIGGTVTLRAALRDPKKFRAIVLLDPVLFVPSFELTWNFVRAIGLGRRFHPLVAGAMKRRRTFDDLEQVFHRYRSREVFRYMSDESLRIYIEGITIPNANGGYDLAFSPEWEAHIYLTGLRDFDLWRKLPQLEVPTLIIRGAETDTFMKNAENLVKKKNPRVQIETLEKSTHLLPLERPREIFALMDSFVKEVL